MLSNSDYILFKISQDGYGKNIKDIDMSRGVIIPASSDIGIHYVDDSGDHQNDIDIILKSELNLIDGELALDLFKVIESIDDKYKISRNGFTINPDGEAQETLDKIAIEFKEIVGNKLETQVRIIYKSANIPRYISKI